MTDSPFWLLFVLAFFLAGYLYYTDKSGTIAGRMGVKITRESDPIWFVSYQLALAVFVVVLLIIHSEFLLVVLGRAMTPVRFGSEADVRTYRPFLWAGPILFDNVLENVARAQLLIEFRRLAHALRNISSNICEGREKVPVSHR